MKYFKRLNQHKNSTGTCIIDYNQNVALSYNWFCIARRVMGFWTVARTSYSVTTSCHESKVMKVLGYDRIKTVSAPKGLFDLQGSIRANIDRINELADLEARGRKDSRASLYRQQEIDFLLESNRHLENLMQEIEVA